MPYYFQSRVATRYFVFRNVRHNGQTIEVDKMYSILAPYRAGIKAKYIAPYTTTPLTAAGGIEQLPVSDNTRGNWSLVNKTNKYPNLHLVLKGLSAISLSAFNTVQLSSKNLSEPFDLIIKDNYFRYRYFLTHPLSGARATQPTLSGRWIYSRQTAFEAYTGYPSSVNYSFSFPLSSNNLLSGVAVDMSAYGYNFVVSDEQKNVVYKKLAVTPFSFIAGSVDQEILLGSFVSKSPSDYKVLLPFTSDGVSQDVDSNTSFGYQVANTGRNIAVSDPLSGSGCIYLYSIDKTLAGGWIANDRVLYPVSATSNFGAKMTYKESRNRKGNIIEEVLVVSTQQQDTSAVEIFTNSVVTVLSGLSLSSYGTDYFQNRWSSTVLTAANISLTGYYGYDLVFQGRDRDYNNVGRFLYVSEPFTEQGYVHMYFLSGRQWHFVTSLSSASATNYGYSIDTGGPYLAVSAPNSIVDTVTGALIDIYKTSTVASTAVGYEPILSNIQYKIEKTDTLFIPSSGNLGKNVKLDVNYCVSMPEDRQTTDFYGDHLVVTGDDKTQVYCRYFDKFLLNTELLSANKSTIWQNSVFQISNSAVKINSIQ